MDHGWFNIPKPYVGVGSSLFSSFLFPKKRTTQNSSIPFGIALIERKKETLVLLQFPLLLLLPGSNDQICIAVMRGVT
jgi:hypothetical protein